MNRAYRIALICGALPLAIGTSIFLLWLITRWSWLIMAGVFTVYGGVVLFLIGTGALVRFCRLAFRTPNLPRRRLWRATLGCAALLISNFPVAGGLAAAALAIETCYTVVVHNASHQILRGVEVSGGGCEADFGDIPAGGIVRRSFWIKTDGELEFRAAGGNPAHAKVIDGYVTFDQGGYTTVTVDPNGVISVVNRFE